MMGLLTKKNRKTFNATHSGAKSKSQRILEQRQRLNRMTYGSLFWLVALVAFIAAIDIFWFEGFIVTKSAALGASLNWMAQAIFAKFVYRYNSAHQRRYIVYQLYMGQIIKWMVTLAGFALIFIKAHPLVPFAVLFGYLTMQVGQSVMLFRTK